MARFRTILSAVARAAKRKSKSIKHISGNNMFYAGMALTFLMDPALLGLFGVLMAIVVFLPSSSDPLTALPPDRLKLWPLTRRETYALRLISPLLNPLAWLILAGLAWRRITWGLWALVASFFLGGFFASAFRSPNVWVPRLPLGRLSLLVRKDLRQFVTALDLYCALLLSLPALILRWRGQLPADSLVPLTAILIVILSTMPLTLFGLDGENGMVRYTLWPVAAWRVLASKGIAYLLLVILVTLPLSPIGGLAGGLVALAVGQWHSSQYLYPQTRWRFRASSPFEVSLGQMLLSLLSFALVTQLGPASLVVPFAAYGSSLWFCVRRLSSDRPSD